MPDNFQILCAATCRDDGAGVKALLDQDFALAQATASVVRWESRIAHFVYAGDTALPAAAAGYRLGIARMLLVAGARAGAAMFHRRGQPLHYAADGHFDSPTWNPCRQVGMIELLLRAGADLHARDMHGATPLHRAVRHRCAAAVVCLPDAGADTGLRNRPGSTPFHLAVRNTGRGGSGAEPASSAQRAIIRTFLEHRVKPAFRGARGNSVPAWAKSEWVLQLLAGNDGG